MSKNKSHRPGWLTKLTHGLLREPKSQIELLDVLTEAASSSLINEDTLHQLKSIIEFSTLTVSDVMLPRGQMVTIEANANLRQALPLIVESSHSRFPVLNDQHDAVVGILLAKDMLPSLIDETIHDTLVADIMRPAFFVPETKHLDALLNEFRTKHAHMAIVVDEYGAIAGLITIEDILEEIVGDIIDETDPDKQEQIISNEDKSFTVDALISIEDFNHYFKSHFSDEDFDTIAGLICDKLGALPEVGETIMLGDYQCEILSRSERRLTKIKVTPLAKRHKHK